MSKQIEYLNIISKIIYMSYRYLHYIILKYAAIVPITVGK